MCKAPQTAISKAVCYKTKNEQLWEKAVHFLLVATNWFYASLPTVFCTITQNLGDDKKSLFFGDDIGRRVLCCLLWFFNAVM